MLTLGTGTLVLALIDRHTSHPFMLPAVATPNGTYRLTLDSVDAEFGKLVEPHTGRVWKGDEPSRMATAPDLPKPVVGIIDGRVREERSCLGWHPVENGSRPVKPHCIPEAAPTLSRRVAHARCVVYHQTQLGTQSVDVLGQDHPVLADHIRSMPGLRDGPRAALTDRLPISLWRVTMTSCDECSLPCAWFGLHGWTLSEEPTAV